MVVFQVEDRDAPRILITEPLAEVGVDLLRRELPETLIDQRFGLAPAQLRAVIGGYTALIIRSETRITADLLAAAPRLQVIGRAGSGVENIDLQAAGRRGVLWFTLPRAMCWQRLNTRWPCCSRWRDIFPLPARVSRLAGGRKAALWVLSCVTRL